MERLRRTQRLDRPMTIWIRKYARKNLWRMPHWYDLEDLVQVGYMVYARCNQHYPMSLKQRHFMALVQISYANKIHRISSERTASIVEVALGAGTEFDEGLELLLEGQPEEATFATMVSQLPSEIMGMFLTILNDARNIPMLVFTNGKRETTKEYLARICGLPEGTDVEGLFRSYLGATP